MSEEYIKKLEEQNEELSNRLFALENFIHFRVTTQENTFLSNEKGINHIIVEAYIRHKCDDNNSKVTGEYFTSLTLGVAKKRKENCWIFIFHKDESVNHLTFTLKDRNSALLDTSRFSKKDEINFVLNFMLDSIGMRGIKYELKGLS